MRAISLSEIARETLIGNPNKRCDAIKTNNKKIYSVANLAVGWPELEPPTAGEPVDPLAPPKFFCHGRQEGEAHSRLVVEDEALRGRPAGVTGL